MKNPICFHVTPTRYCRRYFCVYLWPSLKEMRRYLKDHKGLSSPYAACLGYPKQYPGQCLGEIHFNRRTLPMAVIVHECAHAAIRYVDRTVRCEDMGQDLTASPREEAIANATGAMAHQVGEYLLRLQSAASQALPA